MRPCPELQRSEGSPAQAGTLAPPATVSMEMCRHTRATAVAYLDLRLGKHAELHVWIPEAFHFRNIKLEL